jgi:hypothetical protein
MPPRPELPWYDESDSSTLSRAGESKAHSFPETEREGGRERASLTGRADRQTHIVGVCGRAQCALCGRHTTPTRARTHIHSTPKESIMGREREREGGEERER